MAERTLNHYAFWSFTEPYWSLSTTERAEFRASLLDGLRAAAQQVDVYQVFPARAETDFMVWSALPADAGCDAAGFFERFARAVNPHRLLIRPTTTLWGFTKPSMYSKGRSPQEIDPDLQGDLKLRDMEDDDMAEVSITQPLLKQYKANLNAYCLAVKDYVTRRGGTYLFTSTAVPFDTLVLNYLRERGLLG